MKFWILENNSIDSNSKYLELDFPEISEEMFEDEEHLDILNDKLKELDLDTFSSFYKFDEQREKYYEIDYEELYNKCLSKNANLENTLHEVIVLLSEASVYIPADIAENMLKNKIRQVLNKGL